MSSYLPPNVIALIDTALEEDLGRGDVTSRLTVPPELRHSGRVLAREDLIVSGGDVFTAVMQRVDPEIEVTVAIPDGSLAGLNAVVLRANGPAESLLMAERVALNFLQCLCGVATMTRRYVEALPSAKTKILDTRKTSPGLRYLERRAVRHGGGFNHRVDLAGGILIKENHIAAAGSLPAAVKRCQRGAPHPLRVQVEVRDFAEFEQALAQGADAVLLDNMAPDAIERCVNRGAGRLFIEASGGVTLDTVASIAATGVDAISVGALTHSAPAADLSFLLQVE